jgi:transposase
MQRVAVLVVWGTVFVGLAGAAVAVRGHTGEDPFRYQQSRSLTLTPATVLSASRVEAFVAKAPEPVLPAKRTRPALVRCLPGASGVLRNPWSCTIVYRSGTRAHYRVTVRPDGFYSGTGTGIIEGCCIKTPTAD